MQGAAFDVVADICRESLAQGQRFGVELNARNSKQMCPLFGFLASEDERHSFCPTTDCCTPLAERATVWNAPTIAAVWPDLAALVPRLLQKDACGAYHGQGEIALTALSSVFFRTSS